MAVRVGAPVQVGDVVTCHQQHLNLISKSNSIVATDRFKTGGFGPLRLWKALGTDSSLARTPCCSRWSCRLCHSCPSLGPCSKQRSMLVACLRLLLPVPPQLLLLLLSKKMTIQHLRRRNTMHARAQHLQSSRDFSASATYLKLLWLRYLSLTPFNRSI